MSFKHILNFDYHVKTFLKKESKMHQSLARVCKSMDTKKRLILLNNFIKSQISYCPSLTVIFHSRTLNNQNNKIEEKALRLVYKNETFVSFDNFLKREKSVSTHQKKIF